MAGSLLQNLEEHIGHRFADQALLLEALTHSSCIQEGSCQGRDNELMEFLGDAVLNFFVTQRLFMEFPDSNEGRLSLGRSTLVSSSHLTAVAEGLDLGKYLRMGPAEEKTGGRQKRSILADSVEALLGAIYLDGGTRAAQEFVERFVIPPDLAGAMTEFVSRNHKGALQEFLQSRGRGQVEYRVIEESGLEHEKVFTVEARAGEKSLARAQGSSKKAAEQEAARIALIDLMKGISKGE